MSLRDLIQRDAKAVFLNEDAFGESILIKPDGGTERTITAIVYRDPLTRQGEDRGRTVSAPIAIEVAIEDWAEPTTGAMVKLSPDGIAAARWMPVTEVQPRGAGEDNGMHLLGIGR